MENKLPKGIANEVSDKFNKPGVYRHPETGAEIACYPGKRAVVQADAFVRLGFKRVGDVPSIAEIRARDAAQLKKQQTSGATESTVSGSEPTVQQPAEGEDVAELKKQLKIARAAQTRAENKLKEAGDASEAPAEPAQEQTAEAPANAPK